MHHHTIQINHQLDATISPVYYPDIYLQLNMFRCPHAHPQELNNCSSSLWFYLRVVVITVLLFVFSSDMNNSTAITTIQR